MHQIFKVEKRTHKTYSTNLKQQKITGIFRNKKISDSSRSIDHKHSTEDELQQTQSILGNNIPANNAHLKKVKGMKL